MTPELYYAVMLITNPQKARRILLAEELENWFMDLFDDEYEDIFEGTFLTNQSAYIERIVDKYMESTGVSVTDTDEYARRVIEKATSTASQIQETTVRNILFSSSRQNKKSSVGYGMTQADGRDISDEIRDFIAAGIAFSATAYATDQLRKWLSKERANLIALNEANWIYNNREFFDAKNDGKTKKTWHTALDEKVRETHIALEGVTLPIDEPFHVGAYLMQYPLDGTTYGAGIEEIANCRCSVSFS